MKFSTKPPVSSEPPTRTGSRSAKTDHYFIFKSPGFQSAKLECDRFVRDAPAVGQADWLAGQRVLSRRTAAAAGRDRERAPRE